MTEASTLERTDEPGPDGQPPSPEQGPAGRSPFWWTLLGAVIALVVASCIAAVVARSRHTSATHRRQAREAAAIKKIAIEPGEGASDIRPDGTVFVKATLGILARVVVADDDGQPLPGTLSSGGQTWESRGPLALAAHYRVAVDVAGPRRLRATRTTTFSTVHPSALLAPTITPGDNTTVGVGMPIVVRFAAPVANRDAVMRRFTVDMSQPVEGAWHWFDQREVHYRPKEYWPAGEHITLRAGLTGADAGNNIWGDRDVTTSFTVGDAHVTTVDTQAHTMTVTVNGQVVKTVPQSSGRDKYPTMNGTHIAIEKAQHVLMDSETVGIPRDSPDGYYEDVYWNVAFTKTGAYVHAAPWSVDSQGHQNVSHGCVNLSPDDAKWFYDFTMEGDIIQVTGSPRPVDPGQTTPDWNIPWDQWVPGAPT